MAFEIVVFVFMKEEVREAEGPGTQESANRAGAQWSVPLLLKRESLNSLLVSCLI